MLHRLFAGVDAPSVAGVLSAYDVDLSMLWPPLREEQMGGMWMSGGASGTVEIPSQGILEAGDDLGDPWMMSPISEPTFSGMWMSGGASDSITPPQPPEPPPSTNVGVGVFFNGGRPASSFDSAYTSWFGRHADMHNEALHNNSVDNSWDFAINSAAWAFGPWGTWMAAHLNRRFYIGMAMCPWKTGHPLGGYLAEVASGLHDSKFATCAGNLVGFGLGGTVSRPVYIGLGIEMGGTWFPWGVRTNATLMADYKAAWRRIVTVMKAAQPSANWKFCLCHNTRDLKSTGGGLGLTWAEAIYPGDDVVDLIGGDLYDNGAYSSPPTAQQRIDVWNNDHLPSLIAQNTHAIAHGKRQFLGEWALHKLISGSSGNGGNDNPLFIENTYNWILQHDFEFVNYFDDDEGGAVFHCLSVNTQFPNGAAKYISTFAQLPHPWT